MAVEVQSNFDDEVLLTYKTRQSNLEFTWHGLVDRESVGYDSDMVNAYNETVIYVFVESGKEPAPISVIYNGVEKKYPISHNEVLIIASDFPLPAG